MKTMRIEISISMIGEPTVADLERMQKIIGAATREALEHDINVESWSTKMFDTAGWKVPKLENGNPV